LISAHAFPTLPAALSKPHRRLRSPPRGGDCPPLPSSHRSLITIGRSLIGSAAIAAAAIALGTAPVLADTTFTGVALNSTARNATASLPLHAATAASWT
jgi:hypothetical protein